jgi:hypothetical protein
MTDMAPMVLLRFFYGQAKTGFAVAKAVLTRLFRTTLMSTSKPTDAGAPFDSPHADVILRSSDNVDFRTFKLLLSLASDVTIFEDIFTIPQPASGVNEMKHGVPVIPMSESSKTLEMLLGFCHPDCIPALKTLDIIDDVLAAATKFEMGAVLKWARANLVRPSFMEKQPVRAFAIACKYEMEDEETVLAKKILRILDTSRHAELYIPDAIARRLQVYRADCCQAVRKLTTCFEWIELDKNVAWNRCNSCPGSDKNIKFNSIWWPRQWWIEYMCKAGEELKRCPVSDTVLQPELVEWVIQRTKICVVCCRRAPGDIQKFNQIFAAEVQRVTANVS